MAGVLAAGAAQASDNLPPNLPAWSRALGPGVIEEPYGARSAHEASVLRRYVPWLTQDRQSSVSFTPLYDQPGIMAACRTSTRPITG